jgi:hypothetical protein
LKIGGYITAHFTAGNTETGYSWGGAPGTASRGASLVASPASLRPDIGYNMRFNLSVDTRTNTAYGVLRGYAELQVDHNNGFDGFNPSFASGANNGSGGTNAYMNLAYVQWAGITAGKAPSFFSFYGGGEGWNNLFSPDQQGFNQPLLFAYTATFGGGFSATLAAQSPGSNGYSGGGTNINVDTANYGMSAPTSSAICASTRAGVRRRCQASLIRCMCLTTLAARVLPSALPDRTPGAGLSTAA